jgi:DNA-binding beta-propeller fold protein YncE
MSSVMVFSIEDKVAAYVFVLPAAVGLGACGSAPSQTAPGGSSASSASIPVLGGGKHSVPASQIHVISTQADGLNAPTDLAFNPQVPDQLWVTNHADHSMVIVQHMGTANQSSSKRAGTDDDGVHFLAKPAALAFGAPGRLATAEDEDQITQPTTSGSFMGSTFWSSDVNVFDGGMASHYGMLHNSPLAVGIAWDHDNVFWVFDGTHRSLSRYDFHAGHPLGGTDHSNGEVARFVEGKVARVAGVMSHLKVDHDTHRLYVADTGNNRIAVLDTTTGTRGAAIFPNFDGDLQYEMIGATLSILVDGSAMGLQRPSGLALQKAALFVTDNASSRIYAFDLQGQPLDWLDLSGAVQPGGLMGLTFDAAGNIFLVDNIGNQVLEVIVTSQ